MTYIIALTGGICSGKSTISKKFSNLLGINIIDADTIAKKITQPGTIILKIIATYFGPNILYPDGSLNRFILKQRIFSNPTDKKWLEELLHPIIKKETKKAIDTINTSKYIIWVVPLLIENNLQKYAHRILLVDSHPKIQITRMLHRDKIDKKIAKKILLSQTSRQIRLKFANDVIENNLTPSDITKNIYTLHRVYTNIFYNKNKRYFFIQNKHNFFHKKYL